MGNAAPVVCHYIILCDDVRREDNGKLLILGAYTPDMVVPQLPFICSQLVFLQMLEWRETGQFTLKNRLDCISGSGVTQVANAMVVAQVNHVGIAANAVRFANLVFQQAGDYVYRVGFEGMQEPLIEHKFRVILPPARMPGQLA